MRTRRDFYDTVIGIVLDATTDPQQRGVFTQADLADRARCSTATMTAEMPQIVARSKELHPGYCLEIGKARRPGDGRLVHRYRIVDMQSRAEIDMSQARGRKAETAIRRLINEVEVGQAGPGALAAVTVIEAGTSLVVRGLDLLAEEAASYNGAPA